MPMQFIETATVQAVECFAGILIVAKPNHDDADWQEVVDALEKAGGGFAVMENFFTTTDDHIIYWMGPANGTVNPVGPHGQERPVVQQLLNVSGMR